LTLFGVRAGAGRLIGARRTGCEPSSLTFSSCRWIADSGPHLAKSISNCRPDFGGAWPTEGARMNSPVGGKIALVHAGIADAAGDAMYSKIWTWASGVTSVRAIRWSPKRFCSIRPCLAVILLNRAMMPLMAASSNWARTRFGLTTSPQSMAWDRTVIAYRELCDRRHIGQVAAVRTYAQ